MAENDYPLLVFPAPVVAERARRSSGVGRPILPEAGRQGERLAPQFHRLEQALANRRMALQGSSLGIEPEQVLVVETVGPVENFIRAVQKVEGLEWLAEYELEDIPPGDGFADAKDPQKKLRGQLFLVMSDERALAELQSLFERWRRNPKAKFPYGLAPLKHAFEYLREIRPWGVEDRLRDTGVLEDWEERAAFGQETVSFEAELWYRRSETRRRSSAEWLRQLVGEQGGSIVSECVIEDIAYHAVLGSIEIGRVRELLEQPETRGEVALFRCDDIMYLRPLGQCASPMGEDAEEWSLEDGSESLPAQEAGPPLVALLDGMPLTGHMLLDGRLVVDDPDDYEATYQAGERQHGTAMASLICHDDLEVVGAKMGRRVYVRPIMQPRRGFNGQFFEAVPEDVLPVDLVHRAVVRLFDGEGGEPPVAPTVRIVNLSIGDTARPFVRGMSAWARLLDWLSCKYGVLFVVSAGNHARDVTLEDPGGGIHALAQDARQKLVISAVAEETRHRRLLSPAETLNGVTVGAVHVDASGPASNHLVDPVSAGLPSVISAHGPGYRRAIKPDVLLPGGRQLLSEDPAAPAGNMVLRPAISRAKPGQRVATPGQAGSLIATNYTRGTSNSAALASREAFFFYELLETVRNGPGGQIPADFDAVLVKALLVHGAEWDGAFAVYKDALGANHSSRTFRDYVGRFLGYGRPDFGRVASGDEARVTVLGFGELIDGDGAEFALPLPPSLSGTNTRRRVIVTLAWLSPINSRRQKYRVAQLWFNAKGNVASERSCADWQAVMRGTVQHEVFEGSDAVAYRDGEELVIKVSCRNDAGEIVEPVRFGLVVTLDVTEDVLFQIPIYEEVRARIAVRVPAAVGMV